MLDSTRRKLLGKLPRPDSHERKVKNRNLLSNLASRIQDCVAVIDDDRNHELSDLDLAAVLDDLEAGDLGRLRARAKRSAPYAQ